MPGDERFRAWAMAARMYEVVSRRSVAPGAVALVLVPGPSTFGPASAVSLPGQYWLLDVGDGAPVPVVGTESADGSLEIITARVPCGPPPGEVGERVALRGPFGQGWDLEIAVGRTLLLIGWESRLGLLRPIAEDVTATSHRYADVQLWLGSRSVHVAPAYDDRARWALRGAQVTVTYGTDVRMADAAQGLNYDPDGCVAFLAGPPASMNEAAEALVYRGVPAERIQLATHRLIRCADSSCGRCRITGADTTLFACRNGPVIGYDQLSSV